MQMEMLSDFIQPPLLVGYLAAVAFGWAIPGEHRLRWVLIGLGLFALAFAMILLGVFWPGYLN